MPGQFIRYCKLIVADEGGEGLDLSALHIQFAIRKSDAQTPNSAEIRVYGLAENTRARIRGTFTQVVLQAGYQSGFGVIFSGNIKQSRVGRANGTDSYIDIAAGDGDQDYNFATINQTLAAGATQADQISAVGATLQTVELGYMSGIDETALSRGKVMYGMSRDYLRQSAKTTNTAWSIQDGRLQVLPFDEMLPGQAIVLNSKTGLIGQPEQTNEGLQVRCLLNPKLGIGGAVKINESDIAEQTLPDTNQGAQVNSAPAAAADGIYRLLAVDHIGDTRGNDWYSELVCTT